MDKHRIFAAIDDNGRVVAHETGPDKLLIQLKTAGLELSRRGLSTQSIKAMLPKISTYYEEAGRADALLQASVWLRTYIAANHLLERPQACEELMTTT
jgi:hypothetical protein